MRISLRLDRNAAWDRRHGWQMPGEAAVRSARKYPSYTVGIVKNVQRIFARPL